MNASCRPWTSHVTCEYVMSHMCIRHGARECAMSHMTGLLRIVASPVYLYMYKCFGICETQENLSIFTSIYIYIYISYLLAYAENYLHRGNYKDLFMHYYTGQKRAIRKRSVVRKSIHFYIYIYACIGICEKRPVLRKRAQ